ncbi:hypothetical protein [Chryseolinea lacunae]|uniref:DoxX family protein n=1 Tax=Chryseolinea lacunae TaxID=2801331 RepID=A0ABS1KMV6_9BACT|nr:hypothetical protein [Chryseolinea lacunae]MBL0740663.1 hypothetical protein [Chryseolinea lacunae]
MKMSACHLVFRIACAMCFIGHGMFGFITKKIWCNYFAVFGIGEQQAYKLMPVVGAVDVVLGLLLLVYPLRFAAVWLVFWGLFTASLRPLAGEPFAELIERAGNFGAPVILLLLSAPRVKPGFGLGERLIPDTTIDQVSSQTILATLQIFGFLLLLGHGWLNLHLKAELLNQYAKLGIAQPESAALYIGVFECLAACWILVRPSRMVVLVILIWKVVSEIPYPAYAIFEWVERGGSYAVLLGLWMILKTPHQLVTTFFYFSWRESQTV